MSTPTNTSANSNQPVLNKDTESGTSPIQPSTDYRLPTTDYRLPTTDYRPPSTVHRLTQINPLLWVAALTALAFLLRRFHLGAESLWFDEADIVAQARRPLGDLFEAFARAGENGPLYTLMLHFWMALYDNVPFAARAMHLLFGSNIEAPIRGLAMLFGTAAIPANYALARKIGGTPLGLVSAALLAINPFHLWYSQDAKMYTLLVLMTLLTTWLYLLALERNTVPLWLAYVVATWIMLTSHSLSGLVLLAQIAATPFLFRISDFGFRIGGRAESRNQQIQTEIRNPKSEIRNPHWIWAFTLIILPVFPIIWLRAAALITGTVDSGNWYATTTLPDILLTIFVKFAVNQAAPWQITESFALSWEGIGALTMAALALLGVVTPLRKPPTNKIKHDDQEAHLSPITYNQYAVRSTQYAIILSLWLVPVLAFWLLTIALPLFHPRYLIMAIPPYLVMAAAGLLALGYDLRPGPHTPPRRERTLPRPMNLLVPILPIALLSISTGVALSSVNYSTEPQKEDWRGAMTYVQDHLRLRDVIVPFPGYLQTAVKFYYKPGGPALVPDRPIGTIKSLRTEDYNTPEMELELRRIAECNERAWVIVSPVRADAEDPEQQVLQWFQYNFLTFDTQVFNGVTVYGISFNTVYNCWSPAPDYEEPHTFENGLKFRGYIYELRDQSEAPVQPDASYLPLTLFWQVPAQITMTQDYDIRIKVIAPSGEAVKDETLGPLNGYFPTTQWHPGATYMDYRDIRLPGGLTPGDYRIAVQVHPRDQPDQPLNLAGESGNEIMFNQPLKVVPWQP